MQKKVLITGIHGQDGSYLTELLKELGQYEIYGISLPSDIENNSLDIYENVTIYSASLTDYEEIKKIFLEVKPHLVFNYASISSVSYSWKNPALTMEVNGNAVINMIEIIREYLPNTKFLQASSAEMFAGSNIYPQSEETCINPVSPYGISKVTAHNFMKSYRNSFNLFLVNAILYNHESVRRPESFVTRKIIKGATMIKKGHIDKIELGNLNVIRDWGYAPDYVKAMLLMLERDEPEDFIIATNESHSLKELLKLAFNAVGIDDWHPYVHINPLFVRPADKHLLQGDNSKILSKLNWKPSVSFEEMINIIVKYDMQKNN